MGVLFFVVSLLVWEVVALIVMSGSLSQFFAELADPKGMIFAAAFFCGLYALPIVGFVAIAHFVSQQVQQRVRLPLFVGLCAAGVAMTWFYFGSFPDGGRRLQELSDLILFPTLSVLVLYLGRFFAQISHPIRPGA